MQILFIEVSNMGLITLYNGFDYLGIIKKLFGDSKYIELKLYAGFEN